jgi:1,4-alpha-glucan branching enzyme
MKKSAGGKVKTISFQLTAEPGIEVFVAGSFNNWDPKQYPLRDNPDGGHYKTKLVLSPGRHEYKFIVSGEWRADANCPDWVPNDQGSLNSVIVV